MGWGLSTKLSYAAFTGDEDKVRSYIEIGAEVDSRDSGNRTALHEAAHAQRGHPRVVTRLLDSGWSLEAMDSTGETPLYWGAY